MAVLQGWLPQGGGDHSGSGLAFLATPISGRPLWVYAMVILVMLLVLLAIAVVLTP